MERDGSDLDESRRVRFSVCLVLILFSPPIFEALDREEEEFFLLMLHAHVDPAREIQWSKRCTSEHIRSSSLSCRSTGNHMSVVICRSRSTLAALTLSGHFLSITSYRIPTISTSTTKDHRFFSTTGPPRPFESRLFRSSSMTGTSPPVFLWFTQMGSLFRLTIRIPSCEYQYRCHPSCRSTTRWIQPLDLRSRTRIPALDR